MKVKRKQKMFYSWTIRIRKIKLTHPTTVTQEKKNCKNLNEVEGCRVNQCNFHFPFFGKLFPHSVTLHSCHRSDPGSMIRRKRMKKPSVWGDWNEKMFSCIECWRYGIFRKFTLIWCASDTVFLSQNITHLSPTRSDIINEVYVFYYKYFCCSFHFYLYSIKCNK